MAFRISLSEDVLSLVVGYAFAHEFWTSLDTHFNRVSSSRLFDLQMRLQTMSKQNKSMAEYLKEVKTICNQLTSIGHPVSEKARIFTDIHGLGRDSEPIFHCSWELYGLFSWTYI